MAHFASRRHDRRRYCGGPRLTRARGASRRPAPPAGHVHYRPRRRRRRRPARSRRGCRTSAPTRFRCRRATARRSGSSNQGLNLAYAFNHAEARRAFREAARLDPNLAMAYWGQALVLGPNINALMEPNEEPQRLRAGAEGAVAASRGRRRASGLHRRAGAALLGQGRRSPAARRGLRRRDARSSTQRFPHDLDAAMLYVESVMDLRPWGYWQRDGTPHEGTAEIVALTEQVMAQQPEASRRAAHVHPPDGGHRRRRRRPRRPPTRC